MNNRVMINIIQLQVYDYEHLNVKCQCTIYTLHAIRRKCFFVS